MSNRQPQKPLCPSPRLCEFKPPIRGVSALAKTIHPFIGSGKENLEGRQPLALPDTRHGDSISSLAELSSLDGDIPSHPQLPSSSPPESVTSNISTRREEGMVEPQVGSTTSTRDVYSRRGPALRPPPACRMTRAEVTLLIQQQRQLPLSACLCMCGVCGADHIGWLGEGDLDLSSLRCFPWHGTWAVLYVAAPHMAPFGSNRLVSLCLLSVVGNRCSRWAGEMGIAPHSPRGWHLSAVAFQRRKIDTEPSEHAARQKEKGYVFVWHGMAWHGMAGCLVCMARWCANTASCQPSWLLVLHAIQPSSSPSFPGLDVHMAGEPN